MDLRDLVEALLAQDALAARQWVDDARRSRVSWPAIPRPDGLDAAGMAVAAGVAEMLSERASQLPPAIAQAVRGRGPRTPAPTTASRPAGLLDGGLTLGLAFGPGYTCVGARTNRLGTPDWNWTLGACSAPAWALK